MIFQFKSRFLVCLLCLLSLGCLRTRADIQSAEQAPRMQELQQEKAQLQLQFQEMQDDMRKLIGRVDSVELEMQQQQQSKEEQAVKEDKFKLFEEALLSVEKQLREIKDQLDRLEKDVKQNATDIKKKAAQKKVKPPKGNYASGQFFYKKKDWRKAIEGFNKYRELNPKGRRYLDATLKIGESFQELGMSTEAKVFYDEVIEKNPKSEEAKKARIRLQALSK